MKILLVEDDQATRVLLEQALGTHHTIEVAEDGQSALALAEQVQYDLLLLDVDIPELDGISVCKQLRIQGYQFPILLLTAKDGTSDRVLGLDAGADDYMVKPFHVPELLARIRALLRRSKPTSTSVVTWGDLHVDSLTHEIRYGEQVLRLTPKEHGILELLLLNPQQIFSRSAMINRLWELGEPPTESAISSHIKAIRQKLKAAGAQQDLVETMYGFGYRLRSLETVAPAETDETVLGAEADLALKETETIVMALWEQFKDSFMVQLDVLDQVVSALQTGQLTHPLQLEAKQTVHKLVGSLGVYGFPQGSVLAKQIEALLHSDLTVDTTKIHQMAQWVALLRQEVNTPPKTTASTFTTDRQTARVLVVDDDEALTTRLQAEATARSLHLTAVPNPAAAQSILQRTLPNAILLDLTFADSHDDGLTWLATLRQHHPHIPVLVFTGRDNLCDRIAATRLGVQAFLQKPATVEQIFQAIAQALSPQVLPTGKVLVVDDDPSILHQVSRVLSPWGLQVVTLLDPHRFWEILTCHAPDLLILDIEMPEFSGIELCQVVRHDLKWGNLPILFLTAHHEAEMIVEAFAAGGDDYIRKPILEPELIARVLNRLEVDQVRR